MLKILAPAKINLGLRIVGRREDGYHLLESVFVPLALADELSIEVGRGFSGDPEPQVDLSLEGQPELPADGSNLAVAAARAFLRAAGPAHDGVRVQIQLRKRIPVAAGLGGGSSDAGAVLRGLAELLPESEVALPEAALAVGADVPFFLAPTPSLVAGIGERIEPLAGLPELAVLLANPGISLSTAEVYELYDQGVGERDPSLTAAGPGSTMRALSSLGGDPDALAGLPALQNDLEAAAIRLCPPIAGLRDRIRATGAIQVGMSGSGATVYGLFETKAEAEQAREAAGFDETTWTCVTVTRQDGR
jgi:4-diphosphocytidyl-2-C-methyl-D-erythritol kinase